MSHEPKQVEPNPPSRDRYGFAGALADAWELFTANLRLCLTIFAALHLIAALVSFLLLLAASSLGSFATIPARLTAGVVVPVIAGSLAVAMLSSVLLRDEGGGDPATAGSAIAGLDRGEVVGLTLVAALMAVAAVVFLGGYGILVLAFFYGPPVAMQVAVAERRSISESLQRTRALLAGHWHTMLYLFAVALILGVASIVPVGGLVSLAGERDDLPTIATLSLGRGLLICLFAGLLGAMQIAIYRRLSERPADVTDGVATQD